MLQNSALSKRLIVAGGKDWIAFRPQDSDDDIREHCLAIHGWQQIRIERKPHIVLVQPTEGGQ